jgi:hypothetical protein
MARVSRIIDQGLSAKSQVTRPDTESIQEFARERTKDFNAASFAGQPSDLVKSSLAGAGAGFVFGPIGALLGFAVTNYMSRKEREGAQAATALLYENRGAVLESARPNLVANVENAGNDQDRAEAQARLDAFDTYSRGAFDPAKGDEAFGKALDLVGGTQAFLDDMQGEAIARQQLVEDQERRWQDSTVSLRNKLVGESQPFIQSQRAFGVIDDLTSREPTQIDSQILVNQLARLSNPGEIITEGDIAVLSTGGGLPDQLVNRLNNILLGTSRLTPAVVAEVRESAKSLMRGQVAEQVNRNQEFSDLAEDLEIPADLRANINVPIQVDRARLPRSQIAASLYEDQGQADGGGTETPASNFVERFVTDPLSEAFIPEGGLATAPPLDVLGEIASDPPWLIRAVIPDYGNKAIDARRRSSRTPRGARPTN